MLIRRIEQFLRRYEMPATRFGRLAANDPRFVLDLRMGRIPRERTEARIARWMDEFERAQEAAPAPEEAPETAEQTPATPAPARRLSPSPMPIYAEDICHA